MCHMIHEGLHITLRYACNSWQTVYDFLDDDTAKKLSKKDKKKKKAEKEKEKEKEKTEKEATTKKPSKMVELFFTVLKT